LQVWRMAVIGGIRDPCHSERSEESRSLDAAGRRRFLAVLGMNKCLTTAIPTQEPMKSNLVQKRKGTAMAAPFRGNCAYCCGLLGSLDGASIL
jgi:hypothetical protein